MLLKEHKINRIKDNCIKCEIYHYFIIGAKPLKQTPQVSPGPILMKPRSPHFLPHEFYNFQWS